ncbi:unnamed protein product [Cuscuta campestris]|uniref:Uncharacterized protein n=1 Tax=Cuscuta campestris TaxID=132261 RepID=A0A484N6I9_9ASTE|nr:unnamed protein product [Cuscuta campestris]
MLGNKVIDHRSSLSLSSSSPEQPPQSFQVEKNLLVTGGAAASGGGDGLPQPHDQPVPNLDLDPAAAETPEFDEPNGRRRRLRSSPPPPPLMSQGVNLFH